VDFFWRREEMRKGLIYPEMTPHNRAAFQVSVEGFQSRGIELLLDETLARVLGGLETGSMNSATCTEFTCNVYAPPPPPQG
jgi:hypothetical protein